MRTAMTKVDKNTILFTRVLREGGKAPILSRSSVYRFIGKIMTRGLRRNQVGSTS